MNVTLQCYIVPAKLLRDSSQSVSLKKEFNKKFSDNHGKTVHTAGNKETLFWLHTCVYMEEVHGINKQKTAFLVVWGIALTWKPINLCQGKLFLSSFWSNCELKLGNDSYGHNWGKWDKQEETIHGNCCLHVNRAIKISPCWKQVCNWNTLQSNYEENLPIFSSNYSSVTCLLYECVRDMTIAVNRVIWTHICDSSAWLQKTD